MSSSEDIQTVTDPEPLFSGNQYVGYLSDSVVVILSEPPVLRTS